MNPRSNDRYSLKQAAKASMRHVPGLYLVSLVALVLTSAPDVVIRFSSVGQSLLNASSLEEMLYAYDQVAEAGAAITLVSTLLNVFLALIQAGYTLYTLRVSRGEDSGGMPTLFACFQQFWRFFTANLLMGLFTFLWALLFVIPGIIATLSYSQTIYLMLDDPDLSAMEAIRASKDLMRGHKAEYFTLLLSFIGWNALAAMTMGILNIWLMPYEHITYANYYNALIGWTPPGDLNSAGLPPDPPAETQWWEN